MGDRDVPGSGFHVHAPPCVPLAPPPPLTVVPDSVPQKRAKCPAQDDIRNVGRRKMGSSGEYPLSSAACTQGRASTLRRLAWLKPHAWAASPLNHGVTTTHPPPRATASSSVSAFTSSMSSSGPSSFAPPLAALFFFFFFSTSSFRFFLFFSFFFSFLLFFFSWADESDDSLSRSCWRVGMRGERRGVARRSGLESRLEGEEDLDVEVVVELEPKLELELGLPAAAPVDA